MKNGIKKLYINGIVFFMKCIWFSPSVNYLLLIFTATLIILKAGQDCALNDILMVMLFLTLTPYCSNSVLLDKNNKVEPYFQLFPLPVKVLFRMFFFSALFYSLIVQLVLALLIHTSCGLPLLGNPSVALIEVPNGEVVSMVQGYIVDLSGRVEIPYSKLIRPSLVFGIVKKLHGYPVFPFSNVILWLFFSSLTLYFIVHHNIKPLRGTSTSPFHYCVCGICIAIGLCNIGDFILPGKTIWLWRSQLDKAIWILPVIIVVITFLLIRFLYLEYGKLENMEECLK